MRLDDMILVDEKKDVIKARYQVDNDNDTEQVSCGVTRDRGRLNTKGNAQERRRHDNAELYEPQEPISNVFRHN